MDPVISASAVSKSFQISHEAPERYLALRDIITHRLKRLVKRDRTAAGNTTEEFFALREVSFDVERGDRLGIIGRNGAGKSTLLKILSRITEPSAGRIRIRGRVASLLEVGTGFHPELSGRENIFLNGAILGMSRAEIRRKFDEIVAFSETEQFLDTPVKRFSSGMYVRLAFAVAAHLEPEILIIDEVLAVGDAQFQKKCLGKMEDVSTQEGRTVLFVSHNTGVVAQLCNKAMLLDGGRVVASGKTQMVIDRYIENFDDSLSFIQKERCPDENHFVLAAMVDAKGERRAEYRFDEEVVVSVELFLDRYSPDLELAMRLTDRYKSPVFTIHEPLENHYESDRKMVKVSVIIPAVFIAPGMYSWVMCINKPGVAAYDLQNDVLPFRILESGSAFARYENANYGSVFARYSIQRAR